MNGGLPLFIHPNEGIIIKNEKRVEIMHIGDIIFQLFVIVMPALLIAGVALFVYSVKKRKAQLNRIEEKLAEMSKLPE